MPGIATGSAATLLVSLLAAAIRTLKDVGYRDVNAGQGVVAFPDPLTAYKAAANGGFVRPYCTKVPFVAGGKGRG